MNVCERASQGWRKVWRLREPHFLYRLRPDLNARFDNNHPVAPSFFNHCLLLFAQPPQRIIPSTPVSSRKHECSREVRQIANAPSRPLGAKRHTSTRARIRQKDGQRNCPNRERACKRHTAHIPASSCEDPAHGAICHTLLGCLGSAHQREHMDKRKARD